MPIKKSILSKFPKKCSNCGAVYKTLKEFDVR